MRVTPSASPASSNEKGLRDRDGLEQVLHAQQGALPGAGQRHRQQHRGLFVLLAAQQPAYGVQFHGGFSFLKVSCYE